MATSPYVNQFGAWKDIRTNQLVPQSEVDLWNKNNSTPTASTNITKTVETPVSTTIRNPYTSQPTKDTTRPVYPAYVTPTTTPAQQQATTKTFPYVYSNGQWRYARTNQPVSQSEVDEWKRNNPTVAVTTGPNPTTVTTGTTTTTPTTANASFKTKEDLATAAQNAYNQALQGLQNVTAATALQPRTSTDYPLPVTISTPQSYIDLQQAGQQQYQKALGTDYLSQIQALNNASQQNLSNYLGSGPSTQMQGMQNVASQMAQQNLGMQQGLVSQIAGSGMTTAEQQQALKQLGNLNTYQLQDLISRNLSSNYTTTSGQKDVLNRLAGLNTNAQQNIINQILGSAEASNAQQNALQQMQGLNTNQLQNVLQQTLGAQGSSNLQNTLQNAITSTLNPSAESLANALYQKTATPLQQEFERLRQSTQSSMAGRGLGASTIVEGALEDPTRSYLSQLQQASLGAQIQGQQFAEQQRQASLTTGLNLANQLNGQQLQALQQAGALAGTTAQQNLANVAAQSELANQLAAQKLQGLQQAGALSESTAQQNLANINAQGNMANQLAAQQIQGLQQAGNLATTAAQQNLANTSAQANLANQLATQKMQGLTSAGALANQTSAQQLQGLQQSGNLLSTIEQINQQRPVVAQQLISQASALPGLQQTYGQSQLQNALNAQTAMQNVELYNQQAQQEEWYKRIEQMNNQMKMAIASLNQVSLPMTQLTSQTNAANIANQINQQTAQNSLIGNLIALGLGTGTTNPYRTV